MDSFRVGFHSDTDHLFSLFAQLGTLQHSSSKPLFLQPLTSTKTTTLLQTTALFFKSILFLTLLANLKADLLSSQ